MHAKRRLPPRKSPLAEQSLLKGIPASRRPLDPEGVHRVRRAAKRARAVLRLAEDAGRPDARRARQAISRAMKPLGELRDVTVVARVAERIALKLTDEAQQLARQLAATPVPARSARWWAAEWQRLSAARRAVHVLNHAHLSNGEVQRGLARAVRRVRKRAHRAACHCDDLRCAHEWRKSVLLLRDQLAILAPPARSRAAKLHARLRRVGHLLGRAVDYTLFIATLEKVAPRKSQKRAGAKISEFAAKKRSHALGRAHEEWPDAKRLLGAVKKCRWC